MRHTIPPLPEIRLWAQLSLDLREASLTPTTCDYDSGDNTDCEYASSDYYKNANYDNDYSDDNADCHDASSDNYYI